MTPARVEARLAAARVRAAAERDAAILLLERAREALDDVEPAALRQPLRWHLAATIELCQRNRSLFGLPVTYALDMARAILDEPEVT